MSDFFPEITSDVGMVRALSKYVLQLIEKERKEHKARVMELEDRVKAMDRTDRMDEAFDDLVRKELGSEKYNLLKNMALAIGCREPDLEW